MVEGSDLDLVEFDVSADKSLTESENEGFPLTQLPAECRLASRQQRQQIKKLCLRIIQSIGPLKALYTYPPLAALFIPTPIRRLSEAF